MVGIVIGRRSESVDPAQSRGGAVALDLVEGDGVVLQNRTPGVELTDLSARALGVVGGFVRMRACRVNRMQFAWRRPGAISSPMSATS